MDLHFLKCLRKKKTNRNFQLCAHVCKQVNLSTININWDIMRNATNSKIKLPLSHLTQKMYCERVMRWATDTSLNWNQLVTGLSAGELFFEFFLELWCKMVVQAQTQHWIASIVYDLILNKNHGNSLSFLLFDWTQLSYVNIGG